MQLTFEADYRAYRAGCTYEIDDPVGDILVARGFCRPAKKRKTADGKNATPQKRRHKRGANRGAGVNK